MWAEHPTATRWQQKLDLKNRLCVPTHIKKIMLQVCDVRLWSFLTLSSSGQPADVGLDSEWCRRPDGFWSTSVSRGGMGRCRIWPDSKHTAMEVSLWESWCSGWVRVSTDSAKYMLCFCVSLWWGEPGAHFHHGPAFGTWNSYLFIFLLPFSVSLSLYCVSGMGVMQDYSLAVSACRKVFWS